MDILIDKRTRTRQILPLLTISNIGEVIKSVPAVPMEKPLTEWTIEEFDEALTSPETILMKMALKNRKALVFLGRVRDFYDSLEGFKQFTQKFEIKQSAEEKQAANGVPFPSFGNSMLTTVIEFYHLHSVEEASKMQVREWMLAFQHNASTAMFNKRYSDITTKKAKARK